MKSFDKQLSKVIVRIIVCLTLLTVTAFNFRIHRDYHKEMLRTGGDRQFSDAIYGLAKWIEEYNPANIVALTWGFTHNLYFLLDGRKIVFNYVFTDLNSGEFMEMMNSRFFQQPRTLFLTSMGNISDDNRRELFKKIIERAGKNLFEEKVFYQRDGRPVFVVYSVR